MSTPRKVETFDQESPSLDRALREFDDRLAQERFVGTKGRAQFARGTDAGATVRNRQVTRARGGPVGKTTRAVASVDTDGRHRIRAAAARSTYRRGGLAAAELQAVRQLVDHVRVVTNPESDD